MAINDSDRLAHSVTSAAAGDEVAIRADGTLWGWGWYLDPGPGLVPGSD